MQPQPKSTVEDYLALEAQSDLRHEWINGAIYAMSGGTSRHAAVGANVIAALWLVSRGSSCRSTTSDQRIHVPGTGAYLYPDAALVCGAYHHVDDGLTIDNPAVLVEVLSPATVNHDQGAKFEHYRRLASLRHYLLVDPDEVHVIHHKRVEAGWLRRDLHDGDVVLDDLPCADALRLPLAMLYDRLEPLG